MHEHVGGLQVVVNDAQTVQRSQSTQHLGQEKMSVEIAWWWEGKGERAQNEESEDGGGLDGGFARAHWRA